MLARTRKALVAIAGVIAQAVALGVLPPEWQTWGAVVVALATALGVYATPNAPAVRAWSSGKPGQ